METRRLVVLAFVVAALAAGARGQDSPKRPDYAPIMLRVACGELSNAACGKVLPRIAAQAVRSGVDLQSTRSGTAVDTAAAVCQGQAAAAIVRRDATALLQRQAACLDRYDIVGRPLFPLYALLIVKAGSPVRELNDLGRARRATIAASAERSGAQVTLDFLLRSSAALQRAVMVTTDDADVALRRVADGSVDAYFAMESLDNDLIDRVRLKTYAGGKPLYAFIDVRPESDFFRTGDGRGNCLYRLTALDFGGPAPVTTVSVDAVMILGRPYRDARAKGGPIASEALASAIDAAEAAILADTKSPRDWRSAGGSCH